MATIDNLTALVDGLVIWLKNPENKLISFQHLEIEKIICQLSKNSFDYSEELNEANFYELQKLSNKELFFWKTKSENSTFG
jgi:hypothetical protein